MALPAGTKLGPYEIREPLGAGGMGEVYRARDTRLERDVAVKILPAHVSGDPDRRARFEREARAASSLNHPHICTIHDVGRQDGVDFLVMEYLEGVTLARRLEQGALPAEETLRIAVQVADALDAAHRSGLIHRDLKPGNIMLTPSGAKLMDFGLAKGTGPAGSSPSLTAAITATTPLTAQGTIVGTFQYMAPEQLEGREADARGDIFAFGAVLYEMCTGKPAFAGQTQASVIARILETEPPPVSSLVPAAPPVLDRLVRTCLAKDPEQRRQSIRDVLLDLRWIREGGSEAGVTVPGAARRRGSERAAWALVAVLALLAAGLGVGHLLRGDVPEARSLRASLVAPPGAEFDFAEGSAGGLTLSPDGRYATFTLESDDGGGPLWIRKLDSSEARPLPGTAGAQWPFWSPDGRYLAFFAEGKLKKVDLAGSPALTLCAAPDGRSGGWNADGVILFSPTTTTGIHRVPAAGGTPVPVTELDEEHGETTHRWAAFLPDGRHFLYMAGTHSGGFQHEANAVYVADLDAPQQRTLLVRARSNAEYAAGHLLYVHERVLLAQPFDPVRLQLTGDPVPVASEITYSPGYFRATFAVATDRFLAYHTGGAEEQAELRWFDRSGKELGSVGEPGFYSDLSLSPDGTRLAYSVFDPDIGTADIWIRDLTRDVAMRFTFDPASEEDPVWSPDGKRIAYTKIGKTDDLYVRSSSGGGEAEILLGTEEDKVPTDWSADGRYIIFTSRSDETGRDVWVLPTSGDRKPWPFLKTPFHESEGRLSPDGRFMLYASDESGRNEVYVAPFPGAGGKWQVSRGGTFAAAWSRNGTEILYPGGPGTGVVAVPVEATASGFRIGAATPLFAQRNVVAGDLPADGERFLLAIRPTPEVQPPVTLVTNWTAALDRR